MLHFKLIHILSILCLTILLIAMTHSFNVSQTTDSFHVSEILQDTLSKSASAYDITALIKK